MKKKISFAKRFAAAAAVTTLVTGGIIAGAAPAYAGTGDCPQYYVCTWKDSNFQTNGSGSALIKFQWYIPDYGNHKYYRTAYSGANSASSIYNHGATETAYLYGATSKSGYLFSMQKGTSNSNLWWVGFNDDIESGYFQSFN